jgi:hypothetical protein
MQRKMQVRVKYNYVRATNIVWIMAQLINHDAILDGKPHISAYMWVLGRVLNALVEIA